MDTEWYKPHLTWQENKFPQITKNYLKTLSIKDCVICPQPQEVCLEVYAQEILKAFVPLPTKEGPAPCGFPPSDTCLLCISFSDRLWRNKKKVAEERTNKSLKIQIPHTATFRVLLHLTFFGKVLKNSDVFAHFSHFSKAGVRAVLVWDCMKRGISDCFQSEFLCSWFMLWKQSRPTLGFCERRYEFNFSTTSNAKLLLN